MIVAILLWLIIFCVTHIYGAKIIVTIGIERNFYLSNLGHACIQWLGLLGVGALGLLTTILFPAASGAPQCIILLLAFIFYLKPDTRAAAIDSIKESASGISASAPLLPIVGIYASQPIFLGDSGLYHLSIIRWLTEYGVVTGVAALHHDIAAGDVARARAQILFWAFFGFALADQQLPPDRQQAVLDELLRIVGR